MFFEASCNPDKVMRTEAVALTEGKRAHTNNLKKEALKVLPVDLDDPAEPSDDNFQV